MGAPKLVPDEGHQKVFLDGLAKMLQDHDDVKKLTRSGSFLEMMEVTLRSGKVAYINVEMEE